MRGSTRGRPLKGQAKPVLTTNDVLLILPFFLFALYVWRGGLDDYVGQQAADIAAIEAENANYKQMLRHQEAVAQAQVPAAVPLAIPQPAVAAAPAPVIERPRPAPVAAPAPAKKAASAEEEKSGGRVRPTPPSRPVMNDKAAPSLPPLGPNDPAMPDVPLSQATFIDGGTVNVFPHELSERASLPTLAERDWWPTVEKGWERDTQHGLRAALTKQKGATYIDFGSWIGPTVLFAAPYASKVFALEPDLG